MSIRADFNQAAVDIFNAFDDVPVDAVYQQKTFTYTPGGSNTPVITPYDVRIIYLETSKDTLALYRDVDTAIYSLMIVTSELPVAPDTKDTFVVNGDNMIILDYDQDPAKATTVFTVRLA